MKKTIQTCLLATSLLFCVSLTATHAQTAPAAYHQKDVIGENPTADQDIQTVSDFLNSLVSGDLNKVRSLLATNYKGTGPGPLDSANTEQTIQQWQEDYKIQSDRKITFVTESFRVLTGDLQGNWVSVWGDYSCTIDGTNIKFPFQYTALVANGKISLDVTYYDRWYIFQALGYKVTPPEKSK
jgi:ketosteroid isomerase-like protein